MRLLLTRPRLEAERTASALRSRGHEVLLAPMLEIQNLPGVTFGNGRWSALLMTSGNAARAVAVHPQVGALRRLLCFAVGDQTAEAARIAGFSQVVSARGDGGELARRVTEEVADKSLPLLYVAGDDRARDMAAELAPAGLHLQTVVVYRAAAAQEFSPQIVSALRDGQIDGALHYSRRSTGIFVACAQTGGVVEAAAKLRHFCLSQRASEPLSEIGAPRIFIAARPDEQAMLDLISQP
jgi:uroporphyrinogen-III synthase